MISIFISNVIIIILAIISAFFSDTKYLEILLGGILMILITAGYVTDGHKKLLETVTLFVAVLFAFFSGGCWGFIAVACVTSSGILQTIFLVDMTFVLYYISRMFILKTVSMSRYNTAMGILEIILISAICLVIVLTKEYIKRRAEKKQENQRRMLSYSLNEMYEIKKNKELIQQSFYIDKNARLQERENISRNIHNSVGHSITAAIMTLDAADMLFDKNPEEAHRRMNDAAGRIRGSLESIRSAVRALDTEDEDVSVKDMMCYTDNIIDEFVMDTSLVCDKIYEMYSEDMMLPKEHVEFLTGALSELLTNGVKHGAATVFSVKLSGDSGHIRLDVKDNGTSSFNEDNKDKLIKNGFGLKKMMAYVDRCGGRIHFQNDGGFSSMIEIPLGDIE